MERKYLPTLGELIDRLAIDQIKEVKIPEHRDQYAEEIKNIQHDIDLILQDKGPLDAEMIRTIIVLAQINLHIWNNESNCRSGIMHGNDLHLTHGLNGLRVDAKNRLNEKEGTAVDKKVDCLAADFDQWKISW